MLDMSQDDFEAQLEEGEPIKQSSRMRRSRNTNKDKSPRERTTSSKTRTPKPSIKRVNITAKIKAWLLIANGLAAAYPPIRNDLLDEIEIDASAEAINGIAQENAAVYKALDTNVSGGAFFQDKGEPSGCSGE